MIANLFTWNLPSGSRQQAGHRGIQTAPGGDGQGGSLVMEGCEVSGRIEHMVSPECGREIWPAVGELYLSGALRTLR